MRLTRRLRLGADFGSYKTVLQRPGAKSYFITSVFGRFGLSLYGLGVLLMSVETYDSIARAGIVAGVFSASEAGLSLVTGRLVDKFTQRRVLPLLAMLHLGAMGALIATVLQGWHPAATLPLACLAGGCVPQFGALAAARWSSLLRGKTGIDSAFALEALANDLAFILGPAAIAVIAATYTPTAGVVLALLLVVVSAMILSSLKVSEPGAPPQGSRSKNHKSFSADQFRVMGLLGALNLVLGLTFGTVQLTVVALGRVNADETLAGFLYTTMSLGSLIASALYGLVRWKLTTPVRLMISSLVYFTGSVLFVGAGAFEPTLYFSLFLVGVGIGPAIIVSGSLVERSMPVHRLTQVFAFTGAVSAAGIGLAGVIVGGFITESGAAAGKIAVVCFALVLLATAVALRVLLRRSPSSVPS